MGEVGIKEGAQSTAFRDTCAEGQGGGGVVA